MDTGAQDVCTDILFVGLTRPATMWGIPLTAFVVEVVSTALIFLAVGNPMYLILAAPIHGILYLISANDPGIFNAIYIWTKTSGLCRNSRFWGAASFSPLASKKWLK